MDIIGFFRDDIADTNPVGAFFSKFGLFLKRDNPVISHVWDLLIEFLGLLPHCQKGLSPPPLSKIRIFRIASEILY